MLLQRLCLGVTWKCETSSAIAVAVVRNPFSETTNSTFAATWCLATLPTSPTHATNQITQGYHCNDSFMLGQK